MRQRPALLVTFVFVLTGSLLAACRTATPNLPTEAAPDPTAAPVTREEASPQPEEEPTPTAQPASPGSAADADVLNVRAVKSDDGTWTFHVTVEHPDTGWEDYANGWDVVTLDGTVLKPNPDDEFTRVLLHPHENEQPFTRSQSGIVIPDGVTQVTVRAHDIVDGFGGQTVTVDLTQACGDNC